MVKKSLHHHCFTILYIYSRTRDFFNPASCKVIDRTTVMFSTIHLHILN